MEVIICYDISDNKLRYKLVKYLERFAIRVQYSVFMANVNEKDIAIINRFVDKLLCKGTKGSLQIFRTIEECGAERSKKLPPKYIVL